MKYHEIVRQTNPIAFEIIKNACESNRISHSYLFYGNKEVHIELEPKLLMEQILYAQNSEEAKNINTYSDLFVIDGSKEKIKKEQIVRGLVRMQRKPLDKKGVKFLYIKNVENANHYGLNALLKFLEEPQEKAFVIMTSNAINNVLETIQSRSQNIILRPNSRENLLSVLEKEMDKKHATVLSSVCSSKQQALEKHSDKSFGTNYENTLLVFREGILNPQKALENLFRYLTKENYELFLLFLREFCNDIWRLKTTEQLSFYGEKELLHQYVNIGFDYKKTLKGISVFFDGISLNANFELLKSSFILEVGNSYEKN